MARLCQAIRSGSAVRMQRVPQERRRRSAGLQLEYEAGRDDGLSKAGAMRWVRAPNESPVTSGLDRTRLSLRKGSPWGQEPPNKYDPALGRRLSATGH